GACRAPRRKHNRLKWMERQCRHPNRPRRGNVARNSNVSTTGLFDPPLYDVNRRGVVAREGRRSPTCGPVQTTRSPDTKERSIPATYDRLDAETLALIDQRVALFKEGLPDDVGQLNLIGEELRRGKDHARHLIERYDAYQRQAGDGPGTVLAH